MQATISNAEELVRFKKLINLIDFACAHGFEVDESKSSKSNICLRRGEHKIFVTQVSGGDWLYSDARLINSSTTGKKGEIGGTILDFCREKVGINSLGAIRRELRPWIGESSARQAPAKAPTFKPKAVERLTKEQIASAASALRPYTGGYLESRFITRETVERFSKSLKMDHLKNACFLHFNEKGLTGWEKKNFNFTGFLPGADKALFYCAPDGVPPVALVVCEAAIDAMSHYQMHGAGKRYAYVSISGSPSSEQMRLLEKLLAKSWQVIVATDNDDFGDSVFEVVSARRPDAMRERPQTKDWNDDLKAMNVAKKTDIEKLAGSSKGILGVRR